jgi:sigma-B regulation protein RsbU (phosphoserine phosphatase)
MNKKAKENSKNNAKDAGVPLKKSRVKFSIKYKVSMAIIALVSIVIASFTFFTIKSESDLLEQQVFQFVERELVHLGNTAGASIGIDDIALVNSINDLRQFSYIRYAYVLNKRNPRREAGGANRDNVIIQHFDRNRKINPGDLLDDRIDRGFDEIVKKIQESEKKNPGDKKEKAETRLKARVFKYDDPIDKSGKLYDFSLPVINRFTKTQIATVVIGLSDIVIRQEIEKMIKVIAPMSLAILALAIVGSVILTLLIIKPIRTISKGASIIGHGDLDHRIEIKSSDELGQLASEFNEMTAQIKDAKEKEIESRIMDEQLETAKDIQEGLNPMGYYNKKGIQIKGFTRAAKGVGGDYFDYIDIDENRVGALISDVSGKGIPASLVMVMIRTVFTTYVSRKGVDCSQVVSAINDSLSADFAIDKFATLFFMIYDRSTGELAFSNAGHGPLFCFRASKNACTNTKLDGVPIGIMEDVVYLQAKVKLAPGDIVMMYTDGVTEMRNAAKEEYGIDRVKKFLIDNNQANAEELVEKLVRDVDDFRGEVPPHDDETMLIFKRES